MRTLILISFFACIFLHFHNRKEVVEHDTLSTQQSSIQKTVSKKIPASAPVVSQKEVGRVEDISAAEYEEAAENNEYVEAEYNEDDLSQLPWDDIEEGWKNHLKDFLLSVDPEKAEEMFSAYMEEKKKYVERVDFSDADAGVSEDPSDPLAEYDGREGELERMHVENLKGIFGDYYHQVEYLHKEYVDSVQYLNRTSIKFTISF